MLSTALIYQKGIATSEPAVSTALDAKISAIEHTLRQANYIKDNQTYADFLLIHKIISEGETPASMFARVSHALAEGGKAYYDAATAIRYQKIFNTQLNEFKIVLSTPITTNAAATLTKVIQHVRCPLLIGKVSLGKVCVN